jgi:tRNA (mo5U34)-methyltransferase
MTVSRALIARKVEKLGPWLHNMDLGGVLTAPNHFLGDYPRTKWTGFTVSRTTSEGRR